MRLVQVKWKENNLQLDLYQAATLGVPASGRLIEVRQKSAYSEQTATEASLLVHSQSSPSMKNCIFLHYILEIKPN